jgi:hypothetical protein
MTRLFVIAVILALFSAGTGFAKPPKRAQARPEAFEALVRCRPIPDSEARLRCYDAATAGLQDAADRRDLVVVDRKQMREAKRTLFGLEVPNLNIFGGDDDHEEQISSVEGVIASAVTDANGHWVVRLEDGATWAQTDSAALALRPRPGQKVKIVRAAMGSYMMRVNGQPGIRVKRQV